MKEFRISRVSQQLALCGAGHFVVDFSCALTVVSLAYQEGGATGGTFIRLLIMYNILAFGSQPFWGWILDCSKSYRAGMTAGFICVGLGAAFSGMAPVASVLFLAAGNALFHVGAGALVFNASPGRATGPGLFVAPGGLGLFAGMLCGFREVLSPIWLVPVLILITITLHRQVDNIPDAQGGGEMFGKQGSSAISAVLCLLLLVVAVRSFTGFVLPASWKGFEEGMLLLALAAFTGKSLGGFIADRIGWHISCTAMLVVAAVAVTGHDRFLTAACVAVFSMQTTTGVTLAGIQSIFPERPAFAFGLPCIALLFGACPYLLFETAPVISSYLAAAMCICTAGAAYVGLTLYRKRRQYGVW